MNVGAYFKDYAKNFGNDTEQEQREEDYRQAKIASKRREIAKKQGNDKSSHSGIQTWSRFVPVTTDDCYELGFIYGANDRPFEEGSVIAENARFIEGMQAYQWGYIKGRAVHKPFTALRENTAELDN